MPTPPPNRWRCAPLAALVLAACALAAHAAENARPNLLLFIADDVSWNDYGCYGNAGARTPNIDRLAAHGIRFTEAYLTASSCSPSRCSTVTGRYPHNNGHAAELHRELPWFAVQFPSLLRDAGYYTVLAGKDHMPIAAPPKGQTAHTPPFDHKIDTKAPGNHGGHADWVSEVRKRPMDKPFFFWFASHDAHRDWDGDKEWDESRYGPKHTPETVVVPPFLVDDAATRQDLASYYNEITRFDYHIGLVVKELEAQHALDNTLIFIMADNGRPFPRAKTRVHDSGMKTALVAHWPAVIPHAGVTCDSLVSTIDLAPTYLEAAGLPAAPTMQGVSIMPLLKDPKAVTRHVAFSEHNWHDYEALGRSVRADGYIYIINKRPELPWQGPADSVRSPSHTSLKAVRDAGKLTPAQGDVFLAPRPTEELYKTASDPNQLTNLADNPEYAAVKTRLAGLMTTWREQTADSDPEHLSPDGFDRETGAMINKGKKGKTIGTTPGEDRGADKVNLPGPR